MIIIELELNKIYFQPHICGILDPWSSVILQPAWSLQLTWWSSGIPLYNPVEICTHTPAGDGNNPGNKLLLCKID